MRKLYFTTAIILLLGMANAHAEKVTLEIKANISSMEDRYGSIQSSNALGYNISVGQILTSYFTYDTTTALEIYTGPFDPPPTYFQYDAFHQSLRFSNGNTPLSITIGNHVEAFELPDRLLIQTAGWADNHVNGYLRSNFSILSPYQSLNGYLPTADQWSTSTLEGNIIFNNSRSDYKLEAVADISSVRVVSVVPEPATFAMFAAGALVLLGARRGKAQ